MFISRTNAYCNLAPSFWSDPLFLSVSLHRTLYLDNNALTTLPSGIFDALGRLTYVGPCPTHVHVFLCMCWLLRLPDQHIFF